jgi:tRNA-splicing ligase RtcB
LDDNNAENYLEEMHYCIEFAFANRSLIVDRILSSFKDILGIILHEPVINIAHNYARMENHFGQNVLVHRKGTTSSKHGEVGIIPGSQGTSSYIVRGLGNAESFMSCSHGAGRRMGRKQAERTLNLEDEQKRLNDMGVIHSVCNISDLDEAAGAYKDIDIVMEEQKDLVEIIVKLEPLAVIKG